jgi:hypothetical protein
MKVNETITLTHEVPGSAGYEVYPVFVDKLALIDITTEPPATKLYGAPGERHFTFLAVEKGNAKIQFAEFRRWELPKMSREDPIHIKVDPADPAETVVTAKTAVAAEEWSIFKTMDEDVDAKGVFHKAFKKLDGVGYKPLLVTRQLNGGSDSIFLASADLMSPKSLLYSALVRVRGDAKDAKIVKIVPHGSPSRSSMGSYSPFKEVSEEDRAVFDNAKNDFIGSGFDVKYVSTQLVAGFNYKFAGTQNITLKNPVAYPAFLTVYAPLSGDPIITSIKKVFNLA